jgi:alpha-L-fucosidase
MYTTPAGTPPGTLTLELPVQKPPVVVPVVELFLKG